MIRMLAICDPHLSAHNPAAWKSGQSYEEFGAGLLRQVRDLADVAATDAILVAGDFFHLKSPSRNPLGFVTRTARRLKEIGPPVYGIAGNHDVKGGTIENGGLEGQPLEALVEMDAVQLLNDWGVWIKDRDHNSIGCWLRGASFHHASADPFLNLKPAEDGFPEVWLGHFGFSKDGAGDLFGERIYGPEDLEDAGFDVGIFGHHHWSQGVARRGEKQFVAPGSMTWTSVHKADKNRRPALAVLEIHPTKAINIEIIPFGVPEFSSVVEIEKHEQIKEESTQLDDFISQVSQNLLEGGDPDQMLKEMDLDDGVRRRVQEYLEAAES